jgi:8-oxo-dGTP pyrophosphatase MutT (NUDIX family)
MQPFIVHPIRPDLEVRVTREMPPIPPMLEARIDAIWARAAARVEAGGAGRLFNGRVFSIDTITPGRVTGHLTEYRRLVAQVEDHALFPSLGIRSFAACGVLRCSGGVVIGRRPAAAIYQPGMWQLCPAGSVDAEARRPNGTMDYRAQLLTELREELGLDPDVIGEITPLCLVEHSGSHVCDLGMTLGTTLGPDAILEAHRTRGNGEYDPLRIVPIPDLAAFIAWAGDKLVPPAPLFLARAGLLPRGCPAPGGSAHAP